jgi:signal transduction histidine kinase
MINVFLNYFVNSEVKSLSFDERYRGQLLAISSFAAAIAVSPFAIYRSIWGSHNDVLSLSLVGIVIVLISAPFLYKYSASVKISGVYVNLCSSIILMIYIWFDGSFFSTAIVWYPILPLFAVFYSGRRYGLGIALILFLHLVFLYLSHNGGTVPPSVLSLDQLELLYFGSVTAVMAILFLVALLYLRWKKAIYEELLEASEAKNEFLSGISHELRTPLNSILGFSDVLVRGYAGDLNDKQKEYAGYINQCGDHLLALVDGLLDIGKIESGELALELTPVHLLELFTSCARLLKNKADEKEIEIFWNVQDELREDTALLDELKIRQVIINLLANAIKYSPRYGRIQLVACVSGESLLIEVHDEGPGIPEKYREKIFERFFQLHDASEQQPGTGLGLAISRHFLEMHHGSISLKSGNYGKGCRFVCEIPFKSAVGIGNSKSK